MNNSGKTLIILNPHAGSGRAGKLWSEIEPLLWEALGELVVAVTQHPEEVAEHLDKARDAGLTRVVAIGGDGTNHALVNAIQALQAQDPSAPPMTFSHLPMGTGRDFSRTLGTPMNLQAAVHWIANAQPKSLDIGWVQLDHQNSHYFLNIASAGVSGEVASRVNRVSRRRPWTFHLASLQTIFSFKPRQLKVHLDGRLWYEGKSWVVAVANGRMFGHGMLVAPQAQIDDGLFDVVLIEGIPPLSAALALNSVYSGKHLLRKDVHSAQAKEVIVESVTEKLSLELDGENAYGEHLRFEIQPGALNMLVAP